MCLDTIDEYPLNIIRRKKIIEDDGDDGKKTTKEIQ